MAQTGLYVNEVCRVRALIKAAGNLIWFGIRSKGAVSSIRADEN